MNNYCHPSRENNSGTCFVKSDMEILLNNYNRENPQQPIKESSTNKIRKQLLQNSNCENDICLHEKYGEELKDEKIFRAQQNEQWIKNPTEWLSTFDIEQCLRQYEETYPEFLFYGATPIDICEQTMFNEKVLGKLCDINLSSVLQKGYTKLGVVFNTHTHEKSGEHWFASFMDLINGKLYLFDSNGIYSNSNSNSNSIEMLSMEDSISEKYEPVVKALRNIQQQGNQLYQQKKLKNPFTIYYNTRQHQKTNTECGMYSIYFIVQMVEGADFKKLNSEPIPDNKVFQYRKIFFRPVASKSIQNMRESKIGGMGNLINYIIDPISLVKYAIHSIQGTNLLQNYVKTYLQLK